MNNDTVYAVIESDIVTNLVVWDGESAMEWPSGGAPVPVPAGATGYVAGEAVPS